MQTRAQHRYAKQAKARGAAPAGLQEGQQLKRQPQRAA